MGYATVKNVPMLRDYEKALGHWEKTKPIRGRRIDRRPLGARRDADVYHIRKNQNNNAVECVLINTPVVTFMPDGEVHVKSDGWATVSTRMFVREVLGYSVKSCGCKEGIAFTIGGQVFLMGKHDTMVLRKNEDDSWRIHNAQPLYDYRINRSAAKRVRGRHKEFRTYLSGFIKLRETLRTSPFIGEHLAVPATVSELVMAFGSELVKYSLPQPSQYFTVNTREWPITSKPGAVPRGAWSCQPAKYTEVINNFVRLISSDQDDAIKYANFHKAALILLAYDHHCPYTAGEEETKTYWFAGGRPIKALDEALFKLYSDEVIEKYELPSGVVPKGKYAAWVNE